MAKKVGQTLRHTPIVWLGAAAIIIIFFGTVGTMVVTSQRTAANNPQFQIAEDTAAQIKAWSSSSPSTMTNLEPRVDVSNSLAPFVVIYNNLGQPIDGTGYLNGKLPTIPYGVLRHATLNNPHAITWQPENGVREAAVVSLSPLGNYVLASRSLKEVEQEENTIYLLTFAGMGASLIVLGLVFLFTQRQSIKKL